MHKLPLIATAAVCALAVAAPAASAQTEPLSATYADHFTGPNGNPACPDDAFGCGSGTAAGLGAFTDQLVFDEVPGTLTLTLTFADGSTLALDEDRISFTGPGASASPSTPLQDEGHPGSFLSTWTVAGGTGSFAGTTGTGTDDLLSAGLIGAGTISGTITTP